MRGTVAGSAEAGFSHALDFHARMGTEAHAWPTTSSRRIPGHYLARAIQTLPDASTVIDTHMDAMIDVPGIGLVRVDCETDEAQAREVRSHFWTPEKAVAVARP
jgi:hypothetical protein